MTATTQHLRTFVKFFVSTLVLTWIVLFVNDYLNQPDITKTQSQIEFEELGLRGSIYE